MTISELVPLAAEAESSGGVPLWQKAVLAMFVVTVLLTGLALWTVRGLMKAKRNSAGR